MRVLFISDVYFPRVNGVSTSIRTFRQDLTAHGVETHLVAPRYEAAGAAEEPQVLRVPPLEESTLLVRTLAALDLAMGGVEHRVDLRAAGTRRREAVWIEVQVEAEDRVPVVARGQPGGYELPQQNGELH